MYKILILLAMFAKIALSQSLLFSNNSPNEPVKLDVNMTKADFIPGVILVRFKDSARISVDGMQGLKKTGVPSVDAIFKEFEVTSAAQVFKGARPLTQKQILKSFNGYTFERPSLHNIYKLTVKDPLREFDAIQALKNDSSVVYAEPDYVYSIVDDKPESGVITENAIREYLQEHAESYPQLSTSSVKSVLDGKWTDEKSSYPKSPAVVTPNDPLYSQQWAIPAVHADAVWDTTTGDSSQIIAFLDTGVDWHHPDLADNIWMNVAEANGASGVDDDHDGYIDDIHGWDFINNDNDPSDDNSHGTHVAGIACAVGNNGIGIAGVDWHAKIMPIKVFQSSGRGDIATIVQGVYYAVAKGATVINMSFGSYARSLTMEAALEYAYAQCVLVAAAGNDDVDINSGPFFPAALSYVLGVEATQSTQYQGLNPCKIGTYLTDFTNYDCDGSVYSQYPDLWNYELRAPGDGIISTIPNGNYRVYSGTSMATPVVAAAVALYRQLNHGESQEQMWGNLINTTSGNLNIFAALSVHPNPQLWFVSHTIVDTIAGDNNNGMVDSGETIQLWFTVRNTWGQADSVFVGLKLGEFEDTSVAHILNPVAFVGSISPYARRTNERNPFLIRISPNVAHDRDIVFDATLWYEGGVDTATQRLLLRASHGTYLVGVMDSTFTLTPDRFWLVNGPFRVGSNGLLIIRPGTHVKLYSDVVVRGKIIAQGTKDSIIVIEGPANFGGFWNWSGHGAFRYVQFLGNTTAINGDTVDHCLVDGFNTYYDLSIFQAPFVSNTVVKVASAGGFGGGHYFRNNFDNCAIDAYWDGRGSGGGTWEDNNFSRIFMREGTGGVFFPPFGSDPGGLQNNYLSFDVTHLRVAGTIGYAEVVNFTDQYWGTTDSLRIRRMYEDFWTSPATPFMNVYPILKAPLDSAHGCVWKVLVDGIDPQDQKDLMNPIGVGPHRFNVYFNRPMDTNYAPQLSFGVRPPFNQQAVIDSARWSPDHKIWTAYKTIKLYTGDGINTIRVAGARDLEGFEIPVEDMRFSFLIDAAGTSSTDFVATAGLGKIRLDWTKPDVSDILGYNLYRFSNVTDTTYSDTTLISKALVTDTTYTDFDVTPGKNYYYAYKVVRTDFTESDYSKFVGTKALTSKPGDSNGDFSINVLDVITDVSYILGQKPQPFIFAAADVNGDSVINILDIVATINIILHPSTSSYKTVAASTNKNSNNQEARIHLSDGKIWLDSPVAVAGLQLTIAGCNDPNVLEYLNGLSGLEVATAKVKQDTVVVIAYSLKGNFIPAGKIALIKSSSKGISIISAIFSGSDGTPINAKIYNNGIPLIPESFVLFQNYPNPFNPSTTIRYGLPNDVGDVQLVIYNVLGQQIKTIEQGFQKKGYHDVIWDGRNDNGLSVASGVYFCQFRIRDNNTLRVAGVTKMMLIR